MQTPPVGLASARGPGGRAATGAAALGSGGLGWLLGVVLQLQQAQLGAPWPYALAWAGSAVLGLLSAWACCRGRHGVPAGLTGILLSGLLAGWGSTGTHAGIRLAQALDPALEGQDLLLTGLVASLPQRVSQGWRFRFEVESVDRLPDAAASGVDPGRRVPSRLLLSWHSGPPGTPVAGGGAGAGAGAGARHPAEGAAPVQAGERWQVLVRLRRPHGLMNPHGFDQELHLFEQGLRATGHVRGQAQRLELQAAYPVERLRQRVRNAIEARVADVRSAGVLAALAVGDQSAIARPDWQLFRDTGIAHLVSISGLHITMFAWVAAAALAALWRCSGRLMLACPAPSAGRWGGLLLATAYAVLSGWGVPSQRTVWMLATVTLLQAMGSRWPWPMVLLAAAVVVSVADPWALLQPGFWLSFVAVGLLMVSNPASRSPPLLAGTQGLAVHGAQGRDAGRGASGPTPPAAPGAWWQPAVWSGRLAALRAGLVLGLRTQLIATLGLAPLTLVFFQQLSLVGGLANLVAIPVVTVLVTPLALLGTVCPPLWQLGARVVQALCAWLQWLVAWPGAVWPVAVAPAWAQASGLLAALLLLLPWPWRLRLLALPLVLPLLWPSPPRPPEGQFELLALDVGQGSALLVRTRAHLLVFDTGPPYGPDSDAGQRVLLPLLKALGEHRVDTLVLSHSDSDHTGGAAALLAEVPVALMRSSLSSDHPLRQGLAPPTRHQPCAAGQRWVWDGVLFELLHPLAEPTAATAPTAAGRAAAAPNSLSCVLRVVAGGGDAKAGREAASVLLTGDIERAQELALVDAFGPRLRSQVLVAPHHGSRTSSSAALLAAVQPDRVVVQAGYRNRFGHPAPEVLARYQAHGLAVLTSPRCGAWWWRPADPPPAGPAGRCERDAMRRYWHWTAAPGAHWGASNP